MGEVLMPPTRTERAESPDERVLLTLEGVWAAAKVVLERNTWIGSSTANTENSRQPHFYKTGAIILYDVVAVPELEKCQNIELSDTKSEEVRHHEISGGRPTLKALKAIRFGR